MTTQTRKRVRAKPEERRAQIIDEATKLIGQRGYYGFGIRELAQNCQITDAGLLHHFGSKEKLLIAVLEDRDRRDAEVVASAAGVVLGGTQAPELSFRQVLDLFHATVARNSTQPEMLRLFTVLQAEALNAAHPAHDYFVARQRKTIDAYRRTVERFVPDAHAAALQLVALMGGLEQEWLRSGQAFDLAAEWDRAAARLLPAPAS
jgi:AcrR family transcriptional regulator